MDRTTKALLASIALGLWMNVLTDWLKPVAVHAQSEEISEIARRVRQIASGTCTNSKLC